MEFGIKGLRFRVWSLGTRGLRFRVWSLGIRGLRFRVWSLGTRGLRFRVWFCRACLVICLLPLNLMIVLVVCSYCCL